MNDLFAAGFTGKGKTIALLELGQSRPADTSQYLSCFGLHNDVKIVHIDGGALPDSTGTLEAEIDTQEIATQAPGAAIVSYEAPNNASGEYDAYSRIVSENRAQVISTSWGKCEAALEAEPDFRGQPVMDALHTVFQQAAAQGQSVFAATGDTGSEDCYDGTSKPPSETLQVDNPADDPFVTGVGGTALLQPGLEPVWNECEGSVGDACAAGGDHAGGGGLSNHFKRPSWQPLASNATCTTCREVPDISANAGVGETFFDSDSSSGPNPLLDHWTAVGGTSIAAPLLAGMAADITQTCKGGRIGNFAPKLNALAATHVYGSALVDVTQGFNWSTFLPETPGSIDLTRTHAGAYKTSTGFDLASGLGVPIATGLTCPHITSLSPNHGPPGIHVTVHGLGLEKAIIKFGSKTATVLSARPEDRGRGRAQGHGHVERQRQEPHRQWEPNSVVLVSGQRHRRVPNGGRQRRGVQLRRRARVRRAQGRVAARTDRRHGRRPGDRRLLARRGRRQRLQLQRTGLRRRRRPGAEPTHRRHRRDEER